MPEHNTAPLRAFRAAARAMAADALRGATHKRRAAPSVAAWAGRPDPVFGAQALAMARECLRAAEVSSA